MVAIAIAVGVLLYQADALKIVALPLKSHTDDGKDENQERIRMSRSCLASCRLVNSQL